MGSFITLSAFCFALFVVNLMFNGSGTEADCGQVPGIGYSTPEDCSSNCTDYCKSQLACENLTDPNYPFDPNHLCQTWDPCDYCRHHKFYPCGMIRRLNETHNYKGNNSCDPYKRCSGNETEFCLYRFDTPPPPMEPAPSFNYCFNPFSGGICKHVDNLACFCTICN